MVRASSDVIGCRRPTSGVFVCMLQTRVTLTTFPIATPRGRSSKFPRKGTINTLVSFDRTDKNKVSFESAKGLLLFLYSHNNEIMCFSKINKINRVRSLPGLCLCHLS